MDARNVSSIRIFETIHIDNEWMAAYHQWLIGEGSMGRFFFPVKQVGGLYPTQVVGLYSTG